MTPTPTNVTRADAYYNEHDPAAAAWLRELIKDGLIAPGVVDERDIQKLREVDLGRYTQVHLFAGVGGWSYALRLAGWPDDRPIWTGSCPCQPFSAAGKRKGQKDARHLWPWMRHLMFLWRPPIAFGEQVASADGRKWLAGVRANLETLGYGVGAADLCAAGVAAPHIRQRLFWVADAMPRGLETWVGSSGPDGGNTRDGCGLGDSYGDGSPARRQAASIDGYGRASLANGGARGLGDTLKPGLERHTGDGDDGREPGRIGTRSGGPASTAGSTCGVADAAVVRGAEHEHHAGERAAGGEDHASDCGGPGRFWSAYDLIPCRDDKARRVEPGTFPLAHGLPGRVGLLRGYGNAIVPQLAAEFIQAYVEVATVRANYSAGKGVAVA